jgi:phage terminase large subunit
MAADAWARVALAGEAGVIVCGREFQNSLDESSMAEVRQAIESEPRLQAHYELGEKSWTRDGRIDFRFTGLRRNIESIKSTSRIRLLWSTRQNRSPSRLGRKPYRPCARRCRDLG